MRRAPVAKSRTHRPELDGFPVIRSFASSVTRGSLFGKGTVVDNSCVLQLHERCPLADTTATKFREDL